MNRSDRWGGRTAGRGRIVRIKAWGGALVALFSFVAGAQDPGGPERFVLETGPACLYLRDTNSPLTVVHLNIPGGKAAVPPGQDGLAHLATRLALEISDMSQARNLMAQATRITMAVKEDYSVISIACLSENLEDALRVATPTVRKPLFTGIRIENIKKVMEIQRRTEEDDSVVAGHNAAMAAIFSGQGCGGAVYGTEESLKAFDKKDISAFYERYVKGSGIFFTVCSDLDQGTVQRLLQDYFGASAEGSGDPVPPPIEPSLPDARTIGRDRDTKQSYVGQAFILPPLSPQSHARSFLLEVLLGKPPGSRLWALRSREELAYNVNARVTWTRGRGLLEAYLETQNDKREKALIGLEEVLGELWKNGIDDNELEATKILARSWFLRSLEGKEARAGAMGFFEALGLGAESMVGLVDEINAVDLEGMNRFIRDVLDPEKALVVLVGPQAGVLEPSIKKEVEK